jgi:hypothetical protein
MDHWWVVCGGLPGGPQAILKERALQKFYYVVTE